MGADKITVAGVQINTGLFINNEWVAGHGEKLDSVDPATEEVIATVSRCFCSGARMSEIGTDVAWLVME